MNGVKHYVCQECGVGLEKSRSLAAHTKVHKMHECYNCKENFRAHVTFRKTSIHMSQVLGRNTFEGIIRWSSWTVEDGEDGIHDSSKLWLPVWTRPIRRTQANSCNLQIRVQQTFYNKCDLKALARIGNDFSEVTKWYVDNVDEGEARAWRQTFLATQHQIPFWSAPSSRGARCCEVEKWYHSLSHQTLLDTQRHIPVQSPTLRYWMDAIQFAGEYQIWTNQVWGIKWQGAYILNTQYRDCIFERWSQESVSLKRDCWKHRRTTTQDSGDAHEWASVTLASYYK